MSGLRYRQWAMTEVGGLEGDWTRTHACAPSLRAMKGSRGHSLSAAGSVPWSAPNQLSTSGPLPYNIHRQPLQRSSSTSRDWDPFHTARDGSRRPSPEAQSQWMPSPYPPLLNSSLWPGWLAAQSLLQIFPRGSPSPANPSIVQLPALAFRTVFLNTSC